MKGSFSNKAAESSPDSEMESGIPKIITAEDSVTSRTPRNKSKRQSDLDSPVIRYGVPILSMATGMILAISSIALFQDHTVTSETLELDGVSVLTLKARNFRYISIIGVTVGSCQVVLSAFNVLVRNSGLKIWCVSQLILSGILGATAAMSYVNGVQETYMGFAVFYTTVLDSAFSVGMALLILLP